MILLLSFSVTQFLLFNSEAVLSPKVVISIFPIFFLTIKVCMNSIHWNRISCNRYVKGLFSRWIVNLTVVPFCHECCFTTSVNDRPFVSFPSTFKIRSFRRKPFFSAGEFLIGGLCHFWIVVDKGKGGANSFKTA